jgi:transcriptional regulator with XRE-family HTH domain
MPHSHVPANIRAEAARRGKSQADLAVVLKLSRQGVSQRLLGRVPFRIHELQEIANYLEVPLSRLVDEAKASA